MAIREKALQSQAFANLKHIYDNRESYLTAEKSKGRKIIGTLGCDVPDEILMAAGYLPVRIYSDPNPNLKDANQYLEFSFDPVVRAQFQKIVDGTYYDLVDRIVISNSTDALIRIYFYLREVHHIEPEKKVPPIYFIDWLFTRTRMHQVRNEGTIGRFIKEVESWTGITLEDDEIRKASEICNENRRALRRFSELRKGSAAKVNSSEALVVIGSSLFMDKDEHSKLVNQVIEDADTWDDVEGPRIYMTGSVQENTDLYDLIESAGGTVVSEDHDWGDRHMDRDVNTSIDPVRGIVDRYMLRMFSSKKAFVSQRVEALADAVAASEADGVLFYLRIYEDSPSWDFPEQNIRLKSMGKKVAYVAKQSTNVSDNTLLKTEIEAFISNLKGGC
ncbi:MAG: 2-hydroxyacyl-CoA dehydratase family protein [Youngiibacter sp.]|nr:2-hydroxyacyl-CoA dehydratase family protein [Youngiibacter sp.]